MLLNRSLLLVAIALITSQAMALGQEMLCQIKYGEKDLDKKYMTFPFLLLKTRCHQIGVEFNELGDSMPEKPIYACCRTKEI